jgi:hypothetical protein
VWFFEASYAAKMTWTYQYIPRQHRQPKLVKAI